jgi:hypothetical protein
MSFLGMVALLVLIVAAWLANGLAPAALVAAVLVWLWLMYVAVLQKRFTGLNRTLARPTPTMGWQRNVRLVTRALRINYVPAQGVNELNEIERTRHRVYRISKRAEVGVFGPKGGVGKSTVTTILGYLSAECSQMQTLLCDVRQKRGNLAERYGLKRRSDPLQRTPYTTVTLRQAIDLNVRGFFWNAVQVQNIIGSVPGLAPLQIIASIMGGKNVKTAFNKSELSAALDQLRYTFTLVIHEAPDELEDYIDLELMRRIDFPIFVHRVNMKNSREELLDALKAYMQYSEFRGKIRDHGRLLVLGTKKGHTEEEFAKVFGFRPEHIFMVPFSTFYDAQDDVDDDTDETLDLDQDFDDTTAQDTHPETDLDRPPKAQLDIPKMPGFDKLQYMRCINSGLASLPQEELTARHFVEQDTTPAPQPF